MDRLVGVCYGFLALLNLWISLTGLAHAHLLTLREASPILGEASSPHVLLAAIAAFILAGTLNLLAGGWVGVQAWAAACVWVAAHAGEGAVGIGKTIGADGGGSLTLAIFAAAVAGTLILAGAVNLTAANRVRRAGIGRGVDGAEAGNGRDAGTGRGAGTGRYGGEKAAGTGRRGGCAVIGMGEKC
ncbi:hypothetical protein GGG16DRAFT_114734 [Schizophyllum commune]